MGRSKKRRPGKRAASAPSGGGHPALVGPDLFLLLQGRLFEKNVSLVVCGESHNDAIDVTRRSPPGRFDPTEGWIPIADSSSPEGDLDLRSGLPRVLFVSGGDGEDRPSGPAVEEAEEAEREAAAAAAAAAVTIQTEREAETTAAVIPYTETEAAAEASTTETTTGPTTTAEMAATTTTTTAAAAAGPTSPSLENIAIRFLYPINGKKNRPVTLGKAKELAKEFVDKYEIEEEMFHCHLVLLWIATTATPGSSHQRVEKGQAFLLEIETEENIDYNLYERYIDAEDEEEEVYDDWVVFPSNAAVYESEIQRRNRLALPDLVAQWMDDVMMVTNRESDFYDYDDDMTVGTAEESDDEDGDNGNGNGNGNGSNGADGNPEDGRNGENAHLEPYATQATTYRYALFEYGDLDSVAHEFSKRRLGMTDMEVTENEYDEVVRSRKRLLKEEHNVWTFDDWFEHVRSGKGNKNDKESTDRKNNKNDPAVHLVLEASVPPWEVEMHRPSIRNDDGVSDGDSKNATAEDFRLHPAAECVRCLSEDSEASFEEDFDPSDDGIGSYIDFVYRRMMAETLATTEEKPGGEVVPGEQPQTATPCNADTVDGKPLDNGGVGSCSDHAMENQWFHCVDTRDLGCEAACHAESLKQHWYDLLTQEESKLLSNPEEVQKDACPVDESGSRMRFLPAYKLNPELIELERLKSEGLLVQHEEEEDDNFEPEDHDNSLDFTFPSFELFFGNNTDNIYYTPHVKMAYSPFLAHCVKSLDNWEAFFSDLFFGGTIPDALGRLSLREEKSRGSVHVRSPILQQWDPESNSYVWSKRDEEDYITCPFFPFAFHLVAKGSSPPRTWSSQLFDNLHNSRDHEEKNRTSRRRVADSIKSWILDSIRRHSSDPKSSDDQECGGEWFASFLRAVHREIYDDIDVSDAAVLLRKNYMKSLSGNRFAKHNIGKIAMPSAKESFDEIIARFGEQTDLSPEEHLVTPRVEVLGKILIDVWMSSLVDFSLLLKIASICSNEPRDNVVVVCYVGSAHAKAVRDFFCGPLGFKRKASVGKFTWDDCEAQTLDLPSKLWNLSELFD